MSMKKILMAAAAVTALTAGSANAASISAAMVSGVDTKPAATTPTPYKIATETLFPAAGTNTTTGTVGDNKVSLTVDQGKLAGGGGSASKDYTVTFTYSGPAKFQRILTTADFTTDPLGSNCTVSPTIANGGLKDGKSIDVIITLASGCTSGSSGTGPSVLSLEAPLTVTGTGDVTVTGKISTGGTTIDNGESKAATLITNASGIGFTAATDTVDTYWQLSGTTAYTTITGVSTTPKTDDILGTYTLKYAAVDASGPFVAASRGTGTTSSGVTTYANQFNQQNLTADVTVTGDVSATTITIGGTAGTKNSAKDSSSRSSIGANDAENKITIAVDSGVKTSQPSRAYSMTVTPKTSGTSFTAPSAKTQALQTVGLEGTNLNVPWVAGSQSPSSVVLRVANNGSTDTGAVTLLLKSPVRNSGTTVGATTCTSSTLTSLAKIVAGGELTISSADLTTCFGDFKRADLIMTVQAPKDDLTAKMRLTTSSGQISETSLGGLKNTGAY